MVYLTLLAYGVHKNKLKELKGRKLFKEPTSWHSTVPCQTVQITKPLEKNVMYEQFNEHASLIR